VQTVVTVGGDSRYQHSLLQTLQRIGGENEQETAEECLDNERLGHQIVNQQ